MFRLFESKERKESRKVLQDNTRKAICEMGKVAEELQRAARQTTRLIKQHMQ